MSLMPRLTLIGLYNYDPTLFDKLDFPSTVNKDYFIQCLLLEYGECPIIYPALTFMKDAIAIWGRKWFSSIEKIREALASEYNPIHNYDRTETYTDSENVTRSGTSSETASENRETGNTRTTETSVEGTSAATQENLVSAYNAETYQKDREQETSGTSTEAAEGTITDAGTDELTASKSGTTSGTETRGLQHTARTTGNIGVTTSQQMVQAEIDLRLENNFYHIMAELFYKEFCMYVY